MPANSYVGLPIDSAIARAEGEGRPWRVVKRDGVSMIVTMDLISHRINFEVVGGRVVAARTG